MRGRVWETVSELRRTSARESENTGVCVCNERERVIISWYARGRARCACFVWDQCVLVLSALGPGAIETDFQPHARREPAPNNTRAPRVVGEVPERTLSKFEASFRDTRATISQCGQAAAVADVAAPVRLLTRKINADMTSRIDGHFLAVARAPARAAAAAKVAAHTAAKAAATEMSTAAEASTAAARAAADRWPAVAAAAAAAAWMQEARATRAQTRCTS